MIQISIRASLRPARGTTPGSEEHPLQWAFERGSELGFDGLELCMGANRNSFVTFLDDALIKGTQALSQDYGVPIYSLSSDWAWAYAVFFPTFKEWGRGVEYLAEDAKLAKELGAHTILMHFATSKGSWSDCKAVLKDVAAAGEEHGVAFGYEANIWERTELGGFEGLLRMTDEIGSPYFGVYLHNAYPRAGLPLHQEIDIAGDRLVPAMHSSSLTSGRVEIDFEQAFAAMRAHFADGAYTFEIPWEEAEDNKKLIDRMIAQYW
jgi:sugar phosphate isomerase/epimerase